jgi:4-amino-4-deoxy-L-arabinose transferase-like glycosyltransferase
VLCLIVAAALAIRLTGAWRGNLMFDESAHLAVAQKIDLHPQRLHLEFRTLDHPLLSVYVLKLSNLLCGDSNLGLRVLHVVFGTATVLAVYSLARHVYSESAGLWAAALLAADQFHMSWSRLFMPEVLMLCFWTLSLRQMLRVLEGRTAAGFALLGTWFGLAYLAKETGLLVVPVCWLFLAVSRECRRLLIDPRWYLAHAVFLAVISPDLIWNLLHFSESYLHRDSQMLMSGFQWQLKPVSLFLGEVFRSLIDENVLDVDYEDGNAFACHWPAGLLSLLATAVVPRWGRLPDRLLVISFALVFVLFTLLPGAGRFDPFWWSSPTLIPAVVFSGRFLEQFAARGWGFRAVAMMLVVYLFAHLVPLALRPGGPEGHGYPRRTADEFKAIALYDAQAALLRNDPEAAKARVIYALNVGGPDARAYYYLAYAHALRGQYEPAEDFLLRSLKMEPEYRAARDLLGEVREHTGR